MGGVFISGARDTSEMSRHVAALLEAAGFETWCEGRDVMAGDNWAKAMSKALENAEMLIVLVSPEAFRSHWVSHEISYALGQRRFEGRLLPVHVLDTDLDDIPWALRRIDSIQWLDVRRTDIDVAASAILENVSKALERPPRAERAL